MKELSFLIVLLLGTATSAMLFARDAPIRFNPNINLNQGPLCQVALGACNDQKQDCESAVSGLQCALECYKM